MTPFEYLLAFAVVVLGLALTELAGATHRLVAAGDRVRLGWLAPLAAVVVFLKIVTQWWTWYAAASIANGMTFEMFIGIVVGAFLLYLLAATPLPDPSAAGEVDLAAHFDRVRGRFWFLFAAHGTVATAVSVWAQMVAQGARFAWSPAYLVAPASIALAFVRPRLVQGLALITFAALYVAQYYGRVLTPP